MNKLFRSIKEKFEHDPLAAAYYFIGIVAFLASPILVILTLLKNSEAVPFIIAAAILLGAIAIILAPKLVDIGRQLPQVLNPRLEILESSYDVSIWKNRVAMARSHRFRALDEIDRYAFQIRLSGSPTLSVNLLSPGRLHGPLEKRDRTRYEVEFPAKLNKGETHDLSFTMELRDPNTTIKPFFSVNGAGAAKIGRISVVIRFPQEKPTSVYHEACAAGTGNAVAPMEDLIADDQGEYSLKRDAVKLNDLHVVSWSW